MSRSLCAERGSRVIPPPPFTKDPTNVGLHSPILAIHDVFRMGPVSRLPPVNLPDPEVILAIGDAARALIANEAFTTTVNDLSSFHLAAICAAPPGSKGLEAREHHHLLHYALGEIVSEIQSRIATSDEMLELIAREDKDEEDNA